jgi:L-ribulose-5-phosphate 3-epimerase
MLKAINAWTFPAAMPPEQQLASAAEAGFEGIELTVATDGPLRFDTPLEHCAGLARRAAELNLPIVSLATDEFWDVNYAAPDPQTRQRAVDLTLRMLDQAAALHAEAILVVPAVVGLSQDPRPRVFYADALHHTFDTLRSLRHEAESRGVTIALENVLNRFLLSPLEAAELLERINSPYVGWYLDTGNVMPLGYPEDWIATLGGRIKCVHVKDYDLAQPGEAGFCPLGEGSVDWARVLAALRQVAYQGPLTFEGPGDPADVYRRLDNILNGRPVLQRDDST